VLFSFSSIRFGGESRGGSAQSPLGWRLSLAASYVAGPCFNAKKQKNDTLSALEAFGPPIQFPDFFFL